MTDEQTTIVNDMTPDEMYASLVSYIKIKDGQRYEGKLIGYHMTTHNIYGTMISGTFSRETEDGNVLDKVSLPDGLQHELKRQNVQIMDKVSINRRGESQNTVWIVQVME